MRKWRRGWGHGSIKVDRPGVAERPNASNQHTPDLDNRSGATFANHTYAYQLKEKISLAGIIAFVVNVSYVLLRFFKRRPWAIVPLVACMIGLVVGVNQFMANSKPAVAPPVVAVSIYTCTVQPVKMEVEVNGAITAWDPLAIGAELSGLRIEKVLVEEGDKVKAGQVLALLNSSILNAELEQAKASLDAGKANLKKAIQPNRQEDILSMKAQLAQYGASVAEAEAHLTQAQASQSEARHNSERYASLVAEGAVSKQDAENKWTLAETAEAEVHSAKQKVKAAEFIYEQARQRLKMANEGGRLEDIQVSKAGLAQLEASVKKLEAEVAQTRICAPDDGLIVKRDAHIGEISNAGKTLFSMVRGNRLEMRAQIAEVDLNKFAPGQKVIVSSYASGGREIEGKVREVSPLIDSVSRQATVRIDLPEDSDLKSGMFAQAKVLLGEKQALIVPGKALANRDNGSCVFVLEGNQARLTPVTCGQHAGDDVEITSGLVAGQQVIVKGAGFLKDGDVVQIGH